MGAPIGAHIQIQEYPMIRPLLSCALLALLSTTGCETMKSMAHDMKAKVDAEEAKSAEKNKKYEADQAAQNSGGATNGGNTAAAGGAAGAANAEPAQDANSNDTAGDAAVADSTSGTENSGADSAAPAPNADPCPIGNTPEQVDVSGTEPSAWTDAQKGWMIKLRIPEAAAGMGDMITTSEVIEAREKVILLESRTEMGGNVVSCSRAWTARRYAKMDPVDQHIEVESKTTDLPNETVDVAGHPVDCKVQKTWSRTKLPDGTVIEGTSIVWSSDLIPLSAIKVMSGDGKGENMKLAMELVDFRN